jgi:hypothetical protein
MQIRNPKSEIQNPKQGRTEKRANASSGFADSGFGFVSHFEIRISNLLDDR